MLPKMETVAFISRAVLRRSNQRVPKHTSSSLAQHLIHRRQYFAASTTYRSSSNSRILNACSAPRRNNLQSLTPYTACRNNTTSPTREPRPLTDRPDNPEAEPTQRDVPAFEITFTCKPCLTRSTHRISKHGYEKGTVLITCPNCKNRHVISDHLGVFSDRNMTIEQLLEERGEGVRKGVVSPDGDIELWDDGTQSARPSRFGEYSENEGVGEKRIRFEKKKDEATEKKLE